MGRLILGEHVPLDVLAYMVGFAYAVALAAVAVHLGKTRASLVHNFNKELMLLRADLQISKSESQRELSMAKSEIWHRLEQQANERVRSFEELTSDLHETNMRLAQLIGRISVRNGIKPEP